MARKKLLWIYVIYYVYVQRHFLFLNSELLVAPNRIWSGKFSRPVTFS